MSQENVEIVWPGHDAINRGNLAALATEYDARFEMHWSTRSVL